MSNNTDRLMNHAQGEQIVTALQTLAAGVTAPEIKVTKTGITATIEAEDSVNGKTSATVTDGGVLDSVITNEYSPSQSYAVGAYVMYQHQLYKCISAVSAQTAAYIVGNTNLAGDWLSLTDGGTAISQAQGVADGTTYSIATAGSFFGKSFVWDEVEGEYSEAPAFDAVKWQVSQMGDYALKSGAAVVITADDTTPPSETDVLWCYPES